MNQGSHLEPRGPGSRTNPDLNSQPDLARPWGGVEVGDTAAPDGGVAADDPRIDRRNFAAVPEILSAAVEWFAAEFIPPWEKIVPVEPPGNCERPR